MHYRGTYFDGQTPTRHTVVVRVVAGALQIEKEDGSQVAWPRGSYEQTGGQYDDGRGTDLVRFERDLESLVMADRGVLRALGRPPMDLTALAAACAALTVVALAAAYLWGLPALARTTARGIPWSWEQRLGQTALDELVPEKAGRNDRCADPEANAAVQAIIDRLQAGRRADAGTSAPKVSVVIARQSLVNALALPGGHVVVFSGLLRQTKRPEELAGVLAHELSHVDHRHPTQNLIRALSIQALLAVMAGDLSSLLGAAASLGSLRYQRSDETTADLDGLRMMAAAGLDPQGMIDMFQILAADDDRLPGAVQYLASHPLTRNRIAALKQHGQSLPPASHQPVSWARRGEADPPTHADFKTSNRQGSPTPTDWARIAHACD